MLDALEPIKGQLMLYAGLAIGVKVALIAVERGWRLIKSLSRGEGVGGSLASNSSRDAADAAQWRRDQAELRKLGVK